MDYEKLVKCIRVRNGELCIVDEKKDRGEVIEREFGVY